MERIARERDADARLVLEAERGRWCDIYRNARVRDRDPCPAAWAVQHIEGFVEALGALSPSLRAEYQATQAVASLFRAVAGPVRR